MLCLIRSYREVIHSLSRINLDSVLGATELDQAKKYIQQDDRDRYIAARIMCIQELRHMEIPVSLPVQFMYGQKGKPYLANCPDFNWSHSGSLVAFYVGPFAGVDIELNRKIELNEFKSVFSDHQLAWIGNDVNRFFQLWSIKEAIMKSSGLGFYLSPERIYPIWDNESRTQWHIELDKLILYGCSSFYTTKEGNKYSISACSTLNELIEFEFRL